MRMKNMNSENEKMYMEKIKFFETFLRRAKEDVDIFLSQSEKHKHVRQMNNQLKESPQMTVKNLSENYL